MKAWLRNSRHIELIFFFPERQSLFVQIRAGSLTAKRVLYETLQIQKRRQLYNCPCTGIPVLAGIHFLYTV